jgi:Zn-dependent protease with chaperone function
MRRAVTIWIALILVAWCGVAQQRKLKPGWNLFSKKQDIQLGREAAAEIEKKVELVDKRELNNYIERIGRALASQPQADDYPYAFKVVKDKNINAFALPGGPTYVNAGLILEAETEAQLAGVLAHEIAHVALRHGTNQVTKANLIRLPVMLAGIAIGSDSLLAQLGQLGVGLGATSLLLKFSRGAERDADLLGARIMSQAGYNPIEMARFFEKLEAEGGARAPQFFSSHPNPGNRVKAVEEEIRYLPQRRYDTDTDQLPRMKEIASRIPPPPKSLRESSSHAAIRVSRPSDQFLQYRSREFRLSYPENWRAYGDRDSASITFAPAAAIQRRPSGATSVGYGAIVSYYYPEKRRFKLQKATRELIERLLAANPTMRTGTQRTRKIRVDGKKAILTVLSSDSHYKGETEIDRVVTVARPQGLFYIVFIAPQSESARAQPVFDKILASVRFTG